MIARNKVLRACVLETLEARQLFSGTAVFLGADLTTSGSWSGHYGANGYDIAEKTASLPTYATVSTTGTPTNWTLSTSDTRALQDPANLSNHAATAWYDPSSFSFNVDVTDGGTHKLSLYAVDFDNASRVETVTITDPSTSAVLDTRTLNGFSGGEYLTYNVSGDVSITVTRSSGPNAVVSGLFFDPAGTLAPPTGVQAVAIPGEVDLTWTAAPAGGTYDISRTDSSGNTTQIATGVTGTSYADTTPTNGTTYTYAVSTVSDGTASANSTPSAPTTPGGIWVPLASSGTTITETPDIMSDTVSNFGTTTLPAGLYRVDYLSGVMTYSLNSQGYRVNAFSDGEDGFEVSQNGAISPGTDVHTPGTEVEASTPSGSFTEANGQPFSFSGGSIGVYLHDNPYSDNSPYPGMSTPTFQLERLVTEKTLTGTDKVGTDSATTPTSSTPLDYLLASNGSATISLSTTTSPSPIPTGYSEFYKITGGGSTLTGTLSSGSTTVSIPTAMAENDLTIQTGIGASTSTTFSTASLTLLADPTTDV